MKTFLSYMQVNMPSTRLMVLMRFRFAEEDMWNENCILIVCCTYRSYVKTALDNLYNVPIFLVFLV